MHYKLFQNVFDINLLEEIFEYFISNIDTINKKNGMSKLENPWEIPLVQNKLKPILSKYFNVNLPNIGDNIYKHTLPYFPHVDTSITYPSFNVLIPIKIHNNLSQKFCIFDQYTNDVSSGHTWVGNFFKLINNYEHNKKRKFIFDDNIVENKTSTGISDDFYNNYLDCKIFDKELFKGLNGIAVDFIPGNLIIFDSKYLHCTGKISADWKVGLSLRFSGNFYEQVY
jgi:hypothetical protein